MWADSQTEIPESPPEPAEFRVIEDEDSSHHD
jgi:hypothetical protein